MSDVEQEIADEMGEEEANPEVDTLAHPEGEPVEAELDGGDAVSDAPRSQGEIEALNKKLLAEAQRHENAVRKIMGEDFALLVPSPVDWTPGYIFNVPEMHPSSDQIAMLHAILGSAPQTALVDAEDAEGCSKCNALGEVLTGSKKPGQETKPCSACTGTGWRTKAPPQSPIAHFANGDTAYPPPNLEPNSLNVADRWGRPYGHPHYGIEPAFVTA